MNNFNLSENQKFMVGIGWVEFNKVSPEKVMCCCYKCCLSDSGRCHQVKCSSIERLDGCNGYFTIIPKWRIKTAKKVLRWFGL